MAKSIIICPVCNCESKKDNSAINRANRGGLKIYCGRVCAGIARRDVRTKEQRKADKAEYDKEYRAKNINKIKKKKAAYWKRTYNKEEARIKRAEIKESKPEQEARRREYMKSDKYVKSKKAYDRIYVAKKNYGEFWECQVIRLQIKEEIEKTTSKHEIYLENGTFNKSQKRKREHERLNCNKLKGSSLGNVERP